MAELITVITPTGLRPQAFARCEHYMQRQTYTGDIQWIVIDDAEPRTTLSIPKNSNIHQEYYRGPVPWKPGINTQRPNMHEALQHVEKDTKAIMVWEDDDNYHPTFIDTMMFLLQRFPAVGEANNRYYAIKSRSYKEWKNVNHSSLCSTAMWGKLLPVLYEAVNSGELFMDISFWRKVYEQGHNAILLLNANLGCGIKEMPGRHGIGAGHDPEGQGFTKDPGYDQLKAWTGDDWKWYMELAQSTPEPGTLKQQSWITK